jgi:hypothetical protein
MLLAVLQHCRTDAYCDISFEKKESLRARCFFCVQLINIANQQLETIFTSADFSLNSTSSIFRSNVNEQFLYLEVSLIEETSLIVVKS